jgi:WD domain, G-beta repeat
LRGAASLQVYGPHAAHDARIAAASFSRDGAPLLAAGGDDRTVTVWTLPLACDVSSQQQTAVAAKRVDVTVCTSFEQREPELAARSAVLSAYGVSCIAWHPLKPLVLAACRDGSVHVFDAGELPRLTPVDTFSLPHVLSRGLQATRMRWDGVAGSRNTGQHAAPVRGADDEVNDVAGSAQHVLAMMLVQRTSSASISAAGRTAGPLASGVEGVLEDTSEWVVCCSNAIICLHAGSYALLRLKPLASGNSDPPLQPLERAAAAAGVLLEPSGPFLAGAAACAVEADTSISASGAMADTANAPAAVPGAAVLCVLGGRLGGDVASVRLAAQRQGGQQSSQQKPARPHRSGWLPAATRSEPGEGGAPSETGPPRGSEAIQTWPALEVFPSSGAPPMSALASAAGLTKKKPGALSHGSGGKPACLQAADRPVTFHKRVNSSGYGLTHGKQRLGALPPTPRPSGAAPAGNGVSRLIAAQRCYPVPGPAPQELRVQQPVHSAAVAALAYPPDGSALACCSRDARAVTVCHKVLLGGCENLASALLTAWTQQEFFRHCCQPASMDTVDRLCHCTMVAFASRKPYWSNALILARSLQVCGSAKHVEVA